MNKAIIGIKDGKVVFAGGNNTEDRIEAAAMGCDVVTVSVEDAKQYYGAVKRLSVVVGEAKQAAVCSDQLVENAVFMGEAVHLCSKKEVDYFCRESGAQRLYVKAQENINA